ncbi:sensor histidine kinase [Novosphingobium aquae]|uniref:histidine kinase n=1 Tax=Novosphingobium aquae TaxID=3133435 RepID=A0ABU8SCR2_9SPHN
MLSSAALSAEALSNVLAQSVDCVKLIDLEGTVQWMNPNGLCAMEIDDSAAVCGLPWATFWPDDTRQQVLDALPSASLGNVVRFDAFCPTMKGSQRWWNVTVTAVKDIDGAPAGFLAISRDITEVELQRQALRIAAEEMRHRLRNTYAMIGSLMVGFGRGHGVVETFAKEMQSRLIALSAAQSLFVSGDAPGDLSVLIPALVQPFDMPSCRITTGQIANHAVSREQADAIALVLGELAVNSAKHGALLQGGTIDVSAHIQGERLKVVWKEDSAVPVSGQSRPGGQGLNLVTRIVKARDGTASVDWLSHGLVVTFDFPRDE